MRKHIRQTRLTLGLRTTPEWVAGRQALRPKWFCRTPEEEGEFMLFIFSELDRRIGAEVDALAAQAQSDETSALFDDLLQSGWLPQVEPKRSRGRPMVDNVVRQFLPAEDAARAATIVHEIFEDYWDKWNRARPSADEIAAKYVGVRLAQLQNRKKRATDRRPE